MSFFILIAILGVAFVVVFLFTKLFPKHLRPRIVGLVILALVAYPFLHLLYPSYWEFRALCESPDRFVVHQVIPVNSVYYDASDFQAYKFWEKNKFESVDIKEGKDHYFRLAPTEEWKTQACQVACSTPSFFLWERDCRHKCFSKTPIEKPELELDFSSGSLYPIPDMPDRLKGNRIDVMAPDGRKLATSSSYRYYPYGTGWATILGAASGSAPSKECRHDQRLWDRAYLRPIKQ